INGSNSLLIRFSPLNPFVDQQWIIPLIFNGANGVNSIAPF
ncbi:866_t:CDS:1, partial [Gigaspora rosea]